MRILDDIKDYITDCRIAGRSHDTYAIEHDDYDALKAEAFIEKDNEWVKNYTPYYSLTADQRRIDGLVGVFMGVNIVRKV